jgi:hypothetical protein
MKRAAVIIGVRQAGDLPELRDAIGGARQMETWAISQQMDVFTFTDEQGPLEVDVIKKKVHELVNERTLTQLVIYFAGHGVNIRYGEYWLLSGAPKDPQAAINLDGAVTLARQSGIPHVVFISDACRTAPEGIQAQYVSGSDIFPNDPVGGTENQVDIFFASTLGRPALEVRDPKDSSGQYKSLYTEILAAILRGDEHDILDTATIENQAASVVRPRQLKRTLQTELDARLRAMNLSIRAVQVPDARITSEEAAWISILPAAWALARGRGGVIGKVGVPGPVKLPPKPQATIHGITEQLLDAVMSDKEPVIDMSAPPLDLRADVERMVGLVAEETVAGEPVPMGVDCGIRVAGGEIAEVFSAEADAAKMANGRATVRIDNIAGRVSTLLVVLGDGGSIVLPAIPGYCANIVLEQGEFVDIGYQATRDTAGRARSERGGSQGERLHALVAMAARLGAFGEDQSARLLADLVSWICTTPADPALAVYAAYASHAQGLREFNEKLLACLDKELGFPLFDIAMLGRRPGSADATAGGASPIPPFPMFSKGWGLMPAFGATLPPALGELRDCLAPSLWSKFTPDGTAILTRAFISRRVL